MSAEGSGVKPEELADDIMSQAKFITFVDNEEVWSYHEGVYMKNGEARIKKAIEAAVKESTVHFTNEVVGHIKRRTYTERLGVDLEWYLLTVQNGVVDLRDGSFHEHSPDRILINKLPVKYDPSAKCPKFFAFLGRSQPDPDARIRLLDHFASCLDKRSKKRRALLSVGERDTGKSTFLYVVESLLGKENVSNVPLQQLCGEDRFAMAQLYGKLANIYADLGIIPLKYLGQFKALTGGDWISAQAKHKDMFDFLPHVKLLFSCNKPPDIKDITDEAFFSRWDVIYWKERVHSQEKDENLKEKLTSPEELSGVLNVLIGVFGKQIWRGSFTFESSPTEVRDFWLSEAEPARVFLREVVSARLEGTVRREALFRKWEEWRLERDLVRVSQVKFNRLVEQLFKAASVSRKVAGKTTELWSGLGWMTPEDERQAMLLDSIGNTGNIGSNSSVGGTGASSGNLWYQGKHIGGVIGGKSGGIADPDNKAVFSGFRRLFR